MDNNNMKKAARGLSFMMFPLTMSAIIALVFAVERLFGVSFVESGIYPRTVSGLKGILFAPLIHSDEGHLYSNLSAFPLLLGMLAMVYRRNYLLIFGLLWVSTGVLVWMLARGSYHIGASGVIYAMASFLLFGGIVSHRRANVAVSLVVILLYGGMVWGLLPNQPHVSWESHLLGGVAGFACAFVFVEGGPGRAPRDSDYDYRMPGFSDASVTTGCSGISYDNK